jgi:hypothetical protein
MVAPETPPAAEPVASSDAGAAAPAPVTAAVPAAAPVAEGAALDVWTLVPPPVRVFARVVLPALLLLTTGWLLGRRGR